MDCMFNKKKVIKNCKKKPLRALFYFYLIICFISELAQETAVGETVSGLLSLVFLGTIGYGVFRLYRKVYKWVTKKTFKLIQEIYEVDKMDGFQFKNFLGPLFESQGYNAMVTQGTGDFGADLILRRKGKKIAVQAKRYSSNIGISAVQQAVAAKGYYKADFAMVVTNQYFTPAAVKLAEANNVRLINRDELTFMIAKERKKGKEKEVLDIL